MDDKESKVIIPLKEFSYHYTGPTYIRGEGMFLYDESGKKYIDAISGLWNVPFGYGNEQITNAVKEQAEKLPYINLCNSYTPVLEHYASELIHVLNGDYNKMIYTCSGSESIECAIKLARKYQRLKGYKDRTKIAVFDISYHGTTYAAMSASGIDQIESKLYGPMVEGFVMLRNPLFLEEEEGRKSIVEALGDGSQVAAILIEPIIGSGGIIPVPDWYINVIKEIACKNDILIIFDEVATGFGRTGSLFAYMDMDIKPDIMCVSKAIDNGMIPMGAVLLSPAVEEFFENRRQYVEHFSTQNGNPIGCAAAYEVLQILTKQETLLHIKKIGNHLYTKLTEKLSQLSNVREIRGKGLMIGIDLISDEGISYSMEKLMEIEHNLQSRGLLVYIFVAGNVTSGINLFPAFLLDERTSSRIVDILYETLSTYEA